MKRTKNGLSVSTQAAVAEVYDVSPDTVQSWVKKGMPGRHGAYKLREISHWLREKQRGPLKNERVETTDPLLAADVDSPGLERYRLAKAAITELELERLKGTLIPIEKAREALGRWASLFRRTSEALAKRFGHEASQTLNDTLQECRRILCTTDDMIDDLGPADETDE